ncbi:BRO-N domain-containing protein [Insolitispirillum peregrinum]|uniref:BRO-N domain-containing protein n=1 Tax=Insolitispirillum peregrinum TaxID=80876 RepID=UPI00361480DC
MSTVIPFEFNSHAVRVVEIDGEPWFVGKDVAEVLGYADTTNAMKQHCRGVAKRHPIVDSLGRSQQVRVLSEPDVLRLMISSTLPAAQEFEALVFEVILPTIRKTGKYAVGSGPEQGSSEREQRLTNELVTLQQKHIKALNDLEELRRVHDQWIARNRHWFTIERLIKEGFDAQTIATLAETTTAYVEHIRISVKKMQDAEQAPA